MTRFVKITSEANYPTIAKKTAARTMLCNAAWKRDEQTRKILLGAAAKVTGFAKL